MALENLGRSELTNLFVQEMKIEKPEATQILEDILKAIADCFQAGESVKIPGFGTFLLREKTARPGRNPQTGKTAEISARRVVTFRPSTALKESLNNRKQT